MGSSEKQQLGALVAALREEIALVEAQLQRSRAARGGGDEPALRHAGPSPSPARPAPPRGTAAALPPRKEGYLWHVPSAGGGLSRRYFVVGPDGISWFETEAARRQRGARPGGSIPFAVTTKNSRGSVFRKAAVVWPLILPEDYPAVAQDGGKTYFAVDYFAPLSFGARLVGGGDGGDGSGYAARKLVLAANLPAERDEWVLFLQQYIGVYLAPRAESEELLYLRADAEGDGSSPTRRPMYRSEVLDGEAPGGNYL